MQRSRPPNSSRGVRNEGAAGRPGRQRRGVMRLGAHYKFTTDAKTCCCCCCRCRCCWDEDEDETAQRSSRRGAFVSTTTLSSSSPACPFAVSVGINAVLCLAGPFSKPCCSSAHPPSPPSLLYPVIFPLPAWVFRFLARAALRRLCLTLLYCLLLLLLLLFCRVPVAAVVAFCWFLWPCQKENNKNNNTSWKN